MLRKYQRFIRALSLTPLGKTGVVLTTSSFITIVVMELARLLGIVTNAYIGLLTYLVLPVLFVMGLIIIPIAWQRYIRARGKSAREILNERIPSGELQKTFFGSPFFLKLFSLTLLNLFVLVFISSQMLSFMDEPEFCGTACHVMNPEWTAYRQSPHSKVPCVDCHVGQGVDALVSSKLNGAWQMISLAFDLYEKPIPTPVHNLRPANETCGTCHSDNHAYGTRIKTWVKYDKDEANTPAYTTLSLKVGDPQSGAHWHTGETDRIRFMPLDPKREKILWVETMREDGSFKRFTNSKLAEKSSSAPVRTMDCVDCHNRVAHIYQPAGLAVNNAMRDGAIDPALPYIKREAMDALSGVSGDKEQGLRAIETHITGYYQENYPRIATAQSEKVEQAVLTLQKIYDRNIHPDMEIGWNSYANQLGHDADTGCFRCHNKYMKDEQGKAINYECTTCHSILAEDAVSPLQNLLPAREDDPEKEMKDYLRREFLENYK